MNIFKHIKFKMPAFTITEAVITLAVVGILWSLSVVIFIPKTKDIINRHHMNAAKMKLTKAMEVMNVNNKITSEYTSTQDFVNVLKKYLAIQKICDNEHLSDCFDYETIRLQDGTTLNLSDLSDGSGFSVTETNTRDYSGDTVGIRTLDGTSMVLAWNKKCKGLKPGVYSWSNGTNRTTECLIALIDANGDDSPNILGKDVEYFNIPEEECGIKFSVGGQKYCWGTPFIPTPLTNADCTANRTTYGITECYVKPDWVIGTEDDDYWGGAMKQCKSEGKKLPNSGELAALATYLYDKDTVGGDTEYVYGTLNTTKLTNLSNILSTSYASNSNWLYLWSVSEVGSDCAYARDFNPESSGYDYFYVRNYSNILGVCVP